MRARAGSTWWARGSGLRASRHRRSRTSAPAACGGRGPRPDGHRRRTLGRTELERYGAGRREACPHHQLPRIGGRSRNLSGGDLVAYAWEGEGGDNFDIYVQSIDGARGCV